MQCNVTHRQQSRSSNFKAKPTMAIIDIKTMTKRYIESCNTHGVIPNDSILCVLYKAEEKICRREFCSVEVFLDHLKDADFLPLLDMCLMIDRSEIDAVDMCNGSPCGLKGENALTLMRAVNQKLRVVDLNDSFGKNFSRDLSQNGLPSQFLVLMASNIRKLNMSGKFTQIRTLNLDFSSSLMSFHEGCFASMPNLKRLSMCETRISNLWTTSAALSKLLSLVEVRFQNWLCCSGADLCVTSSCENLNKRAQLVKTNVNLYSGGLSVNTCELLDENSIAELVLRSLISVNEVIEDNEAQNMIEEDSSDYSETELSNHLQDYGNNDLSASVNVYQEWDEQDSMDIAQNQSDAESTRTEDVGLSYIPYHTSPICFERHYREYMIASLPRLKTLDNLTIRDTDKETACKTYLEHFEHLPYRRNSKESLVSILQKREVKARSTPVRNSSLLSGNSQNSYTKSFCAAKMGSSAWPLLRALSISGGQVGDERPIFRPRQFEYHPCDSSIMVFGTLDGEVVVLNHESERIISYIHSLGAMNSVLGLCWLKKFPSKDIVEELGYNLYSFPLLPRFLLIAGSDNGSLKIYDIRHVAPRMTGVYNTVTFDEFDQLTSVHVNSTDELFLASGYSRNVALYDIGTGKRVEVFENMHREHINVVKFANHSPSIFATSSFDQDVKMWDLRQKQIRPCYTSTSSRGNVMACFSPDDHYLLVSGVDNEVRQLLATDGRLHLKYDIAPTRSSQNYTRSYYMNGRDYIISGSCDEYVVRVCCAQTGRRLRDISLEGKASGTSMYVQSLRGDPFQDFSMSILAAYTRPSTRTEIVKVNMLASSEHADDHRNQQPRPNNCMGG